MENKIGFDNFNWYPEISEEALKKRLEEIAKRDSRELLIVPLTDDFGERDGFGAFILSKYYTEEIGNMQGVMTVTEGNGFHCLHVSELRLRLFFSACVRWSHGTSPAKRTASSVHSFAPSINPISTFLDNNTPAKLEAQLSERLIGQQKLTKAVADFLYYHALRQLHPELPQRPLLVSGPSGSGKTEVWRVAKTLYGHLFPIKIIDGSNMSCEGWSGNYKIDTYIDPAMVKGGILVVDEFDKLTRPRFSSANSNVSLDMQAEFLKLIEGEYQLTKDRKATGLTSRNMGFVLVGAFETLTRKKLAGEKRAVAPIGFCAAPICAKEADDAIAQLCDDDFIAYGIMPELVGRIAAKCTTNALSDQTYIDIVRAPNSRVSVLTKILSDYGAKLEDVVTDADILQLVATSQANQTGVRWVVSQIENRILSAIYQQGLHTAKQSAETEDNPLAIFEELLASA